MRQLGDLLVGMVMVVAVVAVLYLTPQLAHYVYGESHGHPGTHSQGLALLDRETVPAPAQ